MKNLGARKQWVGSLTSLTLLAGALPLQTRPGREYPGGDRRNRPEAGREAPGRTAGGDGLYRRPDGRHGGEGEF